MTLNVKVALLLLGLLAGGVAGYVTRPQPPVLDAAIDYRNQVPVAPASDPNGPGQRILVFALAGGVIGLLVGFAADIRR